jgi:hypothetical protein
MHLGNAIADLMNPNRSAEMAPWGGSGQYARIVRHIMGIFDAVFFDRSLPCPKYGAQIRRTGSRTSSACSTSTGLVTASRTPRRSASIEAPRVQKIAAALVLNAEDHIHAGVPQPVTCTQQTQDAQNRPGVQPSVAPTTSVRPLTGSVVLRCCRR